jgi:hypothetical protein
MYTKTDFTAPFVENPFHLANYLASKKLFSIASAAIYPFTNRLNVVAYTSGARQRPLSKQQYDQPLLGNNSVNNGRC